MSGPNGEPVGSLYGRVLGYQDELTEFFTNSGQLEITEYAAMRRDLLQNEQYAGLAPEFIKKCRDTRSLWSFAKSIDSSWEQRRRFLREAFEPLLDKLENDDEAPFERMPGQYDATAWTGLSNGPQRVRAIRQLIPVAQSAISSLIEHLDQPGHNGGPRLDEVETALDSLKQLHQALGELLSLAEEGRLLSDAGEGLLLEISRFARRSAKALRDDPLPYAVAGTVLAICTAFGVPGLGGYLGGVALAMKRPLPD